MDFNFSSPFQVQMLLTMPFNADVCQPYLLVWQCIPIGMSQKGLLTVRNRGQLVHNRTLQSIVSHRFSARHAHGRSYRCIQAGRQFTGRVQERERIEFRNSTIAFEVNLSLLRVSDPGSDSDGDPGDDSCDDRRIPPRSLTSSANICSAFASVTSLVHCVCVPSNLGNSPNSFEWSTRQKRPTDARSAKQKEKVYDSCLGCFYHGFGLHIIVPFTSSSSRRRQ